ncbi:MAG: ABC transporter substrate binding protein [Bacteroidales bacterium]
MLYISYGFTKGTSKILLINSYHSTLSWTDSLNIGFINTLKDNNSEFETYIENLDLKRNKAENYIEEFKKYIIAKYHLLDINLIVVTDNDALNFAEEIKNEVFQEIPVVFCGINNRYEFAKNFTGVIEEVNISKNLDLIANIHPKLNNLYCIVDQTTTGEILAKSVLENIANNNYTFNINIITGLSLKKLIDTVKSFKEESAILFILYNKDNQDHYLTYGETLDSISKYSKVPIYGTWSFYLGHGVVGGCMVSGLEQGKIAGEVALKILEGTQTDEIKPVVGATKYTFDYTAMSKFKIGISDIPKESIILNNPYTFFKKNKTAIIFALTIFIVLLVIIYLLAIINGHRRKLIKLHKDYNLELKEKNLLIKESLSKAEEANALKSAFLANMSHEIRTPMNAIIGFARLIQIRKNLSKEEISNFVNIIVDNSQKLLNLINDIIDISKIEANQLKVNIQTSNINSILRDCINIAEIEKDRLNKKEISLNLIVESGHNNIIAETDPDRVHQVIMNFLNNALKFTDKGIITLGCSINNNWIEVFVQDTGIGVDTKDKEVIFDRFRQVDSQYTKKHGGSGLGLSICKGIINELGGEIGMESKIGKGSRFWFKIPNNTTIKQNPNLNPEKNTASNNFENKTILIVEDNHTSSKLLIETLKHTKAKLIITSNAEEAIDICKSNSSINIILMDIQLPGINGYEAVKIIRQTHPNIPIIAQTANAMSDEKEKALKIGCNDYISKPYDMEYLLKSIDRFVN